MFIYLLKQCKFDWNIALRFCPCHEPRHFVTWLCTFFQPVSLSLSILLMTCYTAVSAFFLWTGLCVDFSFPCAFLGAFRRETEVAKLLLYPSFPALSIEDSSTNPAIFESTTFFSRIRLPSTRIRRIWIFFNLLSRLEKTGIFLNPERKSCRFKNILIRVDGIWVTLRTLRMSDDDGDDDDHIDLFSVLVGRKTCPCWICCACVQFQIIKKKNSSSFVLSSKTLETAHFILLIGK